MSRVFLAQEAALGRQVVIKVLPPELAHAVSSERFRQEIRLAARLNHPHIVPVLAAGESDGVPYYTMPFVEGESLRLRLGEGPLPIPEVVSVLRDVARALAYAHEHGVVHRDIKPDNVLLSGYPPRHGGAAGGWSAAVTDFGVAKAVSAATTSVQGGLTSLGVILGTLAYMAPEQGAGDPATDHRADLYAFGCLAYEILTGRPPFATRPPAELIAAHALEAPEPIASRRADVPPALADLVMRCLAKRPTDRPQSGSEVLQALDEIQSQGARPQDTRAAARSSRRWLIAGIAAALVLAIVAASFIHLRAPAQPKSLGSVAVLPFVNTGGDPKDEYFSDGMTDELAHALARLPDLRVAGRTSSYAYKGKPATVQEIGRELGVAGVIAGTVRRSGDRLRVTVQLSSAADGFELWSHEYESRSADVFQVQDEFTRAIVSELEPTLRGSTAAGLARGQRGTADATAYEHYLKGRYFWSRRGATGLLRSLEEYRAAIARDSSFARAWAGMALAYLTLPSYAAVHADSLHQLTVAAARRALALDSAVTDGHLALAGALTNRGELASAEVEFRRLLLLAPNDPTVHQWYSELLNARGRVEESLVEVRRAAALDPLSAPIRTDVGVTLLSARRYDEASAAARRALELDSTFTYAHWLQTEIYALTGHLDSAVAAFGLDRDDGRGTWRGSAGWRGLAAWLYGIAGRRADAERLRVESARELGAMGSYEEAMAALGLGQRERSVAALARSLERHELLAIEASPACNPIFEPLHRLRSYQELMRRYGMRICDG
jgi:eukaryotic-like serine/threonine-protein kinase